MTAICGKCQQITFDSDPQALAAGWMIVRHRLSKKRDNNSDFERCPKCTDELEKRMTPELMEEARNWIEFKRAGYRA